jgi:hypothetical protein
LATSRPGFAGVFREATINNRAAALRRLLAEERFIDMPVPCGPLGGRLITIADPLSPHALVFRHMAARVWRKVAGADAVGCPRIIIE